MNLYDFLLGYFSNEMTVKFLYYTIVTLTLLLVCAIINFIIKRVISKFFIKIIKKNNYIWDDIFLENKVFHRISLILPGIIIFMFSVFYNNFQSVMQKISVIYILIVITLVLKSFLDSVDSIYRLNPVSKERPIKGLLQIFEIIIYVVAGIAIVANIINKNPIYLLSGIGAVTAVISLIFKDIIIGFVSGIQLTWNDMLRIGDWVEMPKYGVDGNVVDITLNIVKIQNWDKTISTIPTYAFVSDSFKNWRGMMDFGARRIKRSIYIDMNSIKICSEEMIERFKRVEHIGDYIEEKSKEIDSYNSENNIYTELAINGRHLTNLGVFRIYILNYLKHNIQIHKDTEPLVRQLAPSENGIPIEIYAFVSGTALADFERVQADIFDHLLAAMDVFELRVFQNPTGNDINKLGTKLGTFL